MVDGIGGLPVDAVPIVPGQVAAGAGKHIGLFAVYMVGVLQAIVDAALLRRLVGAVIPGLG
jgi:hypothetical protein